ncbi:Mitochondrial inner membrane protein oxa1l [Kappamyces sp. JEL0680]|nr:Mitochondrial inner membrane protein oxa1l [Kappamyces sp. JEL0680]
MSLRGLSGLRSGMNRLHKPLYFTAPAPLRLAAPAAMQQRSFWGWGKKSESGTAQTPPALETAKEVPSSPAPPPAVDESIVATATDTASAPSVELVDSISSTITSISSIGDFKAFGLCSPYTPVGWIESAVELTHVSLGLPWWGTIIASTVLVRLLLFPIVVKAQRTSVLLQNMRPAMDAIKERSAKLKKLGDLQGFQRENMKMMTLFQEHKMSPLSPFWGMVQIPVFISFFLAVKKMAEIPLPGLSTGGALWFTDLTLTDPYFILPVAASGAMILSMELNKAASANISTGAKNGIRIASLVGVFFLSYLPAAVMVYTMTNGIVTLLQILLLQTPKVRNWLGMPKSNVSVPPPSGMLATKPLSLSEAAAQLRKSKHQ